VPEFRHPDEIVLSFDEARAMYLTLSEAFDRAEEGSELRPRRLQGDAGA
jgi:hypothetical protein